MDSTTSAAHRRVGAAAVMAFLALLLLGLARNAAQADPAATPAATPTVEPAQPLPRQSQAPPFHRRGDGDGGYGHDGDGGGGGFGGGGLPGGGGGLPGGGGGTAPAPSTGGSTGGSQT